MAAGASGRVPPGVLTIVAPATAPGGLSKQARYSRRKQSEAAEIGDLPAVVNPDRKAACRLDLRLFLQSYFPFSTGLSPFSEDHHRVIERIQRCAIEGGRFCNAVYRGFAKTTISQNAAIWALLYGHRRYVAVFGAEQGAADTNIAAIKLELSDNDMLYDDFPEVCHAIRALEGKPQRAMTQTYQGVPTHVQWKADTVVLPSIAGSTASAGVLVSRGLTGATRGLVIRTPDGRNLRPDFAIVDDPQTDESASTPHQVRKRLNIISRSILRLGGHATAMACVVNATVIARDDLVEQLLDAKKSPAWQGERIKMVRQWATAHESFWLTRYADARNTWNRDDPEDQRRAREAANELYREHRAEADAGAEVSWEHCYSPGTELSAIQHAYNIYIDDGPDVFSTECQNEPVVRADEAERLTAAMVRTRVNGLARYAMPRDVEYLTAFVDVQDACLYYLVAGWSADFTGVVVDYGTFPDQQRRSFLLRDVGRTLAGLFPGQPPESQWFGGLNLLLEQITARAWVRADGTPMPVGKVMIDANYGKSTKTVKQVCALPRWSSVVTAAHGTAITASGIPMGQWKHAPGERHGRNWVLRPDKEAIGLRHATYDGNYWKSFVHDGLRLGFPATRSISFWGESDREHEMLADHLTAEIPVETEGRGRKVMEWKTIPSKPDNHFLDCLVGSAVAASILGAGRSNDLPSQPIRRKVPIPSHMRIRR